MAPSIITMAKLALFPLGAVINAAAVAPASSSTPQATPTLDACTFTLVRGELFTTGPVSTIWTSTVTSNFSVDCGNCSAVTTSVIEGGVGPLVSYNETVTATEASTTTAFACQTTTTTHSTSFNEEFRIEKRMLPPRALTSSTAIPSVPFHQGEPKHKVVGISSAVPSVPSQQTVSNHKVVVGTSPTASLIPSVPAQQTQPNHKVAGVQFLEISDPPSSQGITSTITAPGITSPTCTSSFALAPNRRRATLTIYPSTITKTSRIYCGSCALVWSTAVSSSTGTPAAYVATKTTKKPATETHLKCHKHKPKKTTATPTKTSAVTGAAATAATDGNEVASGEVEDEPEEDSETWDDDEPGDEEDQDDE